MFKKSLITVFFVFLCVILGAELIPVEGYTAAYRVFDLLETENTLWAATWGGLVEYDIETDERTVWNSFNSGLSGCHVTALGTGNNGELIVGTSLNIVDDDNENYGVSGLHIRDTEGNWQVFTVYNSDLPCPNVRAIMTDSSGNCWIGTSTGGVAVISESGEWTIYNIANSDLPSNSVTKIYEDEAGTIWLCCKSHYVGQTEVDGGFASYDGEAIVDHTPEMPHLTTSAMDVMDMTQDAEGTIWIAALYSDYYSFDGTEFINYEVPEIDSSGYAGPSVRSIGCKSDGSLIMGTSSGVAVYDGMEWSRYDNQNSAMGEYNINVIKVREDDTVWLGSTFWGIYHLDGSTFTAYDILSEDHSVQCYVISDIECADDGSVWICAADNFTNYGTGGISYLRDGEWGLVDFYQTSNFLYNDVYIANNIVYCATGNDLDLGGVIVGDESGWTRYDIYTTSGEFPFSSADDVTVDGEGWIWASRNASSGGLCVFDGTDYETITSSNSGLLTNINYCIEADPDYPNVVWIGGAAGVQRVEHNNWFSFDNYHPGNTPMTSATVTDLSFDSEGTLWVATDNGVSSFDGTDWTCWNEYLPQYMGTTNAVWDIYCDSSNRVWCATFSGLGCLLEDGGMIFTANEISLPSVGITQVAVDTDEHLWIGTYCSGVYCYDIVNVTGKDDTALQVPVIDHSNFPNPFNPETSIRFNLPAGSNVEVTIYDLRGRKIRTLAEEYMPAGSHTLNWNGKDKSANTAASGIYFYRITTDNETVSGKMILMK